ncbi:MAG: D-alanine--D-alanine ligase, partial [Bacteroidetes bacterium]
MSKSKIKNAAAEGGGRKGQKIIIRVGVIFGGRSAEHEVSLVSATSVIGALDKNKYEVIPIGITQEGKWLSSPDAVQLLKARSGVEKQPENILLPDPTKKGLVHINPQSAIRNPQCLDVIFPILHGSYGEDGTIQGLFELAGIPYVGAGVLGSSAGMDKVIAKQLFQQNAIPVTPYVWFLYSEYQAQRAKRHDEIEKLLGYPCFVKPANSGSSVGISKAHNKKELIAAINLAGEYDRKILVEQGIEHAREIEVSVLGNDEPIASLPGEIISSNEFYDYDAKYVDGKSREEIPAKLPKAIIKKIQSYALKGFKAIECAGMGRVDFLVTKRTNKIFLNEINTIPGFT